MAIQLGVGLQIGQVRIGNDPLDPIFDFGRGYVAGSMQFSKSQDFHSSCSFKVRSSHVFAPLNGKEIGVYDGRGNRVFGGLVNNVATTRLAQTPLDLDIGNEELYEVQASGWEQRLYKRFITGTSYVESFAGEIFTDLLAKWAPGELVYDPGFIDQGPKLKLVIYKAQHVASAWDDLARRSNFIWYVDADGFPHFHERNRVVATIGFTSGGVDNTVANSRNFRDPSIDESRDSYLNKLTVQLSWDAFEPVIAEFSGGIDDRTGQPRRQFYLQNASFPFITDPDELHDAKLMVFDTIDLIQVNGTEESFGIGDFDRDGPGENWTLTKIDPDKEWYWRPGDNCLIQDPNMPFLRDDDPTHGLEADKLRVIFNPLGGNFIQVQVDDEITARSELENHSSGICEELIDDTSEIVQADAIDKANDYLQARCPFLNGELAGQLPREYHITVFSFDENSHQLTPGTLVGIEWYAPQTIGGRLIRIVSVEASDQGGGQYAQGDNRAYFKYEVAAVDWFTQGDDELSPFEDPSRQKDQAYPPGSPAGTQIGNFVPAETTAGTDVAPHNLAQINGRMLEAVASIKTAIGSDITIDILQNGVSIFDGTHFLTILAGETEGQIRTFATDPLYVNKYDVFSMDIIAGGGDELHVQYKYGGLGPQ